MEPLAVSFRAHLGTDVPLCGTGVRTAPPPARPSGPEPAAVEGPDRRQDERAVHRPEQKIVHRLLLLARLRRVLQHPIHAGPANPETLGDLRRAQPVRLQAAGPSPGRWSAAAPDRPRPPSPWRSPPSVAPSGGSSRIRRRPRASGGTPCRRPARVHRLVRRLQRHALHLEFLNDAHEVAEGTCQAVDLRHHEGVALPKERENGRQLITALRARPAPLLAADDVAPGPLKRRLLKAAILVPRAHPCISDLRHAHRLQRLVWV